MMTGDDDNENYYRIPTSANSSRERNDRKRRFSFNDGRSEYGYRLPRPPFEHVVHTSHTCSSESGQIHIPISVPNLILIGAQKSGTTTIQALFDKHPAILTSVNSYRWHHPSGEKNDNAKRETHFFDWNLGAANRKMINVTNELNLCQYRKDYADLFALDKVQPNVSVVFEKTPSYMVYPQIAQMVDAVCKPWKPKILAILRNPIDRAWSNYQMVDAGSAHDFEEWIDEEIHAFVKDGILEKALTVREFAQSKGTIPPFTFPEDASLAKYAKLIEEYRGDRPYGLMLRGMYAPLLYWWVHFFSPEDRLMILQFEKFSAAHNEGNRRMENELLQFAGIDVDNEESRGDGYDENQLKDDGLDQKDSRWKNRGEYEDMLPIHRHYLTLFYKPFNDMLVDLLGDEWKNIWD